MQWVYSLSIICLFVFFSDFINILIFLDWITNLSYGFYVFCKALSVSSVFENTNICFALKRTEGLYL